MTEEDREDMEALRWYVPAIKAHARRIREDVIARTELNGHGAAGITVEVKINGNGHAPDFPAPQPSGQRLLAGHRPTRYALAMRRNAANRARMNKGLQVLPGVMAGDCARCQGWGVVDENRARCQDCNGSGMK